MAGDWIPVEDDLFCKPEVIGIAHRTGRTRHEVTGYLCEFWCWLVRFASESGHVNVPDLSALVDTIGGDMTLWEAVEAEGWIVLNGCDLTVPNWDRTLSKTAKARRFDRYRKRNQRNSVKCPGNVPQIPGQKSDVMHTDDQMTESRDEDIPIVPSGRCAREDEKTHKSDRIDWQDVMARWNQLAAKHGLATLRKIPDKIRTKYQSTLRTYPAFWDELTLYLDTKTSAEFKASGYLTFEFVTRKDKLHDFEQGTYRGAFQDKRKPARKSEADELQAFAEQEAKRLGITVEEVWRRDAEVRRQQELEEAGKEAF